MRSVSDFLAAGRTGGRYLISLSQGTASLGAITIVGMLEMNYIAGFNMRWWEMVMAVVVVGISVSGWVLYRFRQTRCLTMAQFFEVRYSRSFRVFAGALAFVSGIINFGIFPAVSARFFIYFCGLPKTVGVFGLEVSTFALIMIVLLWIPLYFVFSGGQIAVMITDFLQGIFVNTVFIVIVVYLMVQVDWGQIFQALSAAPANASLVNPFHTGSTKDYNFWYFFIGMIGVIYGKLSWQGTQAYNASAKSAHEAKMGDVLANWRGIPQWGLFLVFVPIVAYTFWHGAGFTEAAASVRPVLDGLGSDALRSQLTVPVALTKLLPVGLMGAFAAVMLAAAVGCNETYLHSWGCIFIQDVVQPLRKKAFAPAEHIKFLKASILAVAAFSVRLQPPLPAERVHLPLLRHHRGHLRRRQRGGHHRRPLLEARHDGRGLVVDDRRRGRPRSAASSSSSSCRTSPSTARCSGAWPWPCRASSTSSSRSSRAAGGGPSTWTRCSTAGNTWSGRSTPWSTRSRSRAGRSWAWAGSSPAGTRSSTSPPTPGRPAGSSSSSPARSST
ncbi:MAG: hypothetical protein MZV64_10980 [Ignavibacteriales bacterium]|nr:hypothetical protein [Ignavibacteriales bacterium]